jgi:hypothetical protein
VVVASALGYGTAAVITPLITRRVAKASYITAMLVLGGVATVALGAGFRQPGFLAIGFLLGLAAQGVAICATTILQQQSEDAYRGRVFSLYDMLFNVSFVAGAAVSAVFMPLTGRSYPMLLVVAVGYLSAAGVFRLIYGQSPDRPEPSGGTGGSAGAPSAAAQSRSS